MEDFVVLLVLLKKETLVRELLFIAIIRKVKTGTNLFELTLNVDINGKKVSCERNRSH